MSFSVVALWLITATPQPAVASFQATQFAQVDHVRSLPTDVRQALEQALRREALADPSESFEATDALSGDHLPRRRLIFAGVSESLCFVYYEHGGRGLHQHLLIFARAKGSEARLLENLSMSNGLTTKRPANIKELKAFIAGGRASVASRGEA